MSEFLIHECYPLGSEFVVTGLVIKGTVRVHGRFKLTYLSVDAEIRERVSFVVNRIFAYRHDLEELPEGMTGELRLVGTGIEALKHGIILALDEPKES